MAVWKARVAGFEVKIHNVDHAPPHCHVVIAGRDTQVDLFDFSVLHPPPHVIPTVLRRGLRMRQLERLSAWERVVVIPPGRSPGAW